MGGIGLNRGRRDPENLRVGDALDCWRVEVFEPNHRLRLAAEMKLPGRAWLEFEVTGQACGSTIRQTAIPSCLSFQRGPRTQPCVAFLPITPAGSKASLPCLSQGAERTRRSRPEAETRPSAAPKRSRPKARRHGIMHLEFGRQRNQASFSVLARHHPAPRLQPAAAGQGPGSGLALQETRKYELTNGEFRRSGFLRGVNQPGEFRICVQSGSNIRQHGSAHTPDSARPPLGSPTGGL